MVYSDDYRDGVSVEKYVADECGYGVVAGDISSGDDMLMLETFDFGLCSVVSNDDVVKFDVEAAELPAVFVPVVDMCVDLDAVAEALRDVEQGVLCADLSCGVDASDSSSISLPCDESIANVALYMQCDDVADEEFIANKNSNRIYETISLLDTTTTEAETLGVLDESASVVTSEVESLADMDFTPNTIVEASTGAVSILSGEDVDSVGTSSLLELLSMPRNDIQPLRFLVQRFSSGVWLSLFTCADVDPSFVHVAQLPLHRVLREGVDVTAEFCKGI